MTRKLKSLMARRFATAIKSGISWDMPEITQPQKHQPIIFFFYGTLKDPSTLAAVLDLQELPSLSPATIISYETQPCNELLILILSAGKSVTGVAYAVQSLEQEDRLHEYEGELYQSKACWINIENDKVVEKTFEFNLIN